MAMTFATLDFTLNDSLLNLIDLNFLTYNAFSINTKIWLITVAIAAINSKILRQFGFDCVLINF